MRITIDRDICAGHGQCELVAPGLFQLDDDGYAELLRQSGPSDAQAADRAARACPAGAILVEHDL